MVLEFVAFAKAREPPRVLDVPRTTWPPVVLTLKILLPAAFCIKKAPVESLEFLKVVMPV